MLYTVSLLLALVMLTSTVTSQQQQQQDNTPDICLSLRESSACPAFHQFYVSTGVVDRYPFLPSNITTIQELDAGLFLYVNSTSDYLLPLGCLSTNYSPTTPYARYALTKMCARLIQNEEDSLPCNTEHNIVPPPLCQSTCMDWVNSVTTITSEPRVCSDNSQRTAALANYTSQCLNWHGYNASMDDNCISGFANEPDSCGFRDDINKACQFCQNTTNAASTNCCQRVTCGHSLGVASVIGIAFGAIMVVVLILAGGYFFYSKHFKPQKTATPSTSSSINFSFNISTNNKDKNSHLLPSSTASSYFSDSKTAINEPPKHWSENENSNSFRDVHHHHHHHQSQQEDHYQVIHAYPPQMEDELALGVGDTIMLALPFDDGWALGVNLATGLKGAFPLVCVSPIARSPRLHPATASSSTEHASSSSVVPKRMTSKLSSSPSDYISPFLDNHHTP
ncbi:unnamed protein product [Absidia cylindrospora]